MRGLPPRINHETLTWREVVGIDPSDMDNSYNSCSGASKFEVVSSPFFTKGAEDERREKAMVETGSPDSGSVLVFLDQKFSR
jgi:hypothetical protein